ncbi:MAG: ferritin family protein [Candidatus Avigastranaerophilus sp.]
MPEFSNPFAGNNSDKILNERELVRAVRFSIAGEFEAIQLYEQLADSTDNKQVKTLLNEIAGDEKEHVGNLLRLLKLICPDEKQFYKDGWEETEEILKLKDED